MGLHMIGVVAGGFMGAFAIRSAAAENSTNRTCVNGEREILQNESDDAAAYDVYIRTPRSSDLRGLVREFMNGKEVWPWVWTWRNQNGPHHVFVGVNEDTIFEIERLARDARNNITLIENEAKLFQLRPMQFYSKCQCGVIDERVQLMDVRAKIMMLEDERIICFDRCTIAQNPEVI